MMDLATIQKLFDDKIDGILDEVAVEGLTLLKKILDDSGFADSPGLKDYEVNCHVGGGTVEFEILVDAEGVDEESKRKMRKENEETYRRHAKEVTSKDEARDFVKTYTLTPRGKPQRIVGQRDARLPIKEIRKFKHDARKIEMDRHRAGKLKTSSERYIEHELSAIAPRRLEVDPKTQKLKISLHREIRNTSRKVIFPKHSYQGIAQKFIDQIKDIIAEKFSPELEKIMAKHFGS